MAWAGSVRTLPALLISRLWFNSRMSSCQVDGPGATPGGRSNFYAAHQQCSRVPKTQHAWGSTRAACQISGSWQTSNALALQASLCGSVTHRLHQFQLRETRPMHREKPHKLLQVGVTPTPATSLRPRSEGGDCHAEVCVGGHSQARRRLRLGKPISREVIRLPDCKSGVRKQSRK